MDDKKPTKILKGDRHRQATVNGHEVPETPPYFLMTGRKEIPFYVGYRMI